LFLLFHAGYSLQTTLNLSPIPGARVEVALLITQAGIQPLEVWKIELEIVLKKVTSEISLS